MKKLMAITILFLIIVNVNSQIPNNGFESLTNWSLGNATLSADHFPESIGNYSIKLVNQLPLTNQLSYGYAISGSSNNGCIPSIPVKGHPTKLCGYYKCFPQNGDTIQIGIELFKNGVWIAGGELITTDTVSNWTSFTIPVFSYTDSYNNIDADSATITLAAFYNDTTCGEPYGPFGNSVLYVDNLSYDSLITVTTLIKEIPQTKSSTFTITPNPAIENFILKTTHENALLTVSNTHGVIIKSMKVKERLKEISISDLPAGLYFVTLKTKSSIETKELIIQK